MVIDLDSIKKLTNIDHVLSVIAPHGNLRQAETNNLYGFNLVGTQAFVSDSKVHQGFTFFTRPQLNLQDTNVIVEPRLRSLLTTNEKSIYRWVRCVLDPARSKHFKTHSPLVNENLGLIPVLTNNLKSLSGFPDFTINKEVTEEGVRGEQISRPDGFHNIYKEYDISCTFRVTADFAILRLFLTWMIYICLIQEGAIAPYTCMTIEREIDYQTRIWRILLDKTKRYVIGIGCTGASYPYALSIGNLFDYSEENVYSQNLQDISITFSSMGFCIMDPVLIREFNILQCIFCPDLAKIHCEDDHNFIKVPHGEDSFALNYNAIPVINEKTNEFDWYISKDSKVYQAMKKLYKEE